MRRLFVLVIAIATLMTVTASIAAAGSSGKVWLCHFEDNNHDAPMPYGDDRNGAEEGFWTVDKPGTPDNGVHLTGDYVVRYNEGRWAGIPAGLNSGQIQLCEGNYGEFILVSVNAVGDGEDVRGHRAQLTANSLPTYPDGWKG